MSDKIKSDKTAERKSIKQGRIERRMPLTAILRSQAQAEEKEKAKASAVAQTSAEKKWNIFEILWTAFKKTCTVVGFIILLTAAISIFFTSRYIAGTVGPLPDEMVLLMELDTPVIEHSVQLNPYNFTDKPYTIRQITMALDKAAKDKRIKGFVLSVNGGVIGISHIQELRDSLQRFRKSGKFAYIYAPSYEGQGVGLYYLATAFEEIWMQPLGVVSIPGIQAEVPFAKGALDKLGVEPQFFQRKEYKSVFESFKSDTMSDESREVLESVLDSIGGRIASEVSRSRGIEEDMFVKLVSLGLFTGNEALEHRLIDRLGYPNDLTAQIKLRTGHKVIAPEQNERDAVQENMVETLDGFENLPMPEASVSEQTASVIRADEIPDPAYDVSFINVHDYLHILKTKTVPESQNTDKIALIYAVGNIMQSSNGHGDGVIAADDMSGYIMQAADDPEIGAIVLRVVSPGGSPTASETILHAIQYAQKKNKKVVVSMGAVAASGGYWISTYADRIFALPSTFTGSIGVAGGKIALEDFWPKLGIHWDYVSWGDNAGMWSMNQPFNATGTERMNYLMDYIYDEFTTRVSEGRGIPVARVDKIARGRVWTGDQALRVGLVDEIGGLDQALDYAASLVGGVDRYHVNIKIMPKAQTAIEQLLSLFEAQVSMGRSFKAYAPLLQSAEPVAQRFIQDRNMQNVRIQSQAIEIR